MTISVNSEGKGMLSVRLTGAASTDSGGLGALANPEGVSLLILRSAIYFTAPSTGAANLGIGVAANATTKATDILNDLAVGGVSAGQYYNGSTIQTTAKTQISAPAVWTSDKYVTFTGSATTAGLDATLYIEYVRI